MGGRDWPVRRLSLVEADEDLFAVVRRWAQGALGDVPGGGTGGEDLTLLITTPPPWRSVVAVAQQQAGVLRPMLVLKNAVALWPLPQPPAGGPLPAECWPPLRRLVLIHNPGLGGVLDVLDHGVAPDRVGRPR